QWHSLGLPSDTYTSFDFDPNSAAHLYTASIHGGVFMSTDEGKTWHTANGGLPQGLAINGIAFNSSQHQLWSATSAGVYRADDKGSNWQALNNGLPPNTVAYAVQPAAVVGTDKNLVYLGTNHGVFVSHDQAAHWEQSQNGIQAVSVQRIMIDFRQSDGTALYVTSNVGPLHSTDSGETWGSVASGWPKQTPAYDLALGADGYTRLFVATNDVYLYPGEGGGWNISRILMLLVVVVFFFLLYRMISRSRRRNFGAKKQSTATDTSES
ncbi:MAG: hypothetical protein J2P37_20885, partial [Ktedonobacteraceae bacterium]|nr:hypothetical protein [Ktedonobacteraceae bacterium]